MIIVYTGNGKGKTTAALGAALRAVGEDKRVLMIQFIKGPWKSGEDDSVKKLAPAFEIRKMGLGFVGILGDRLPREDHIRAAHEALTSATREILSGAWDILILDEINNALALGLIPLADVIEYISRFPRDRDLILTGRDAHEEIIARADIVTEMKEVKHAFQEGKAARRGIEY